MPQSLPPLQTFLNFGHYRTTVGLQNLAHLTEMEIPSHFTDILIPSHALHYLNLNAWEGITLPALNQILIKQRLLDLNCLTPHH